MKNLNAMEAKSVVGGSGSITDPVEIARFLEDLRRQQEEDARRKALSAN